MPAGVGFGYVYFAAAKLAGYSGFCRWAIEPQLLKAEGALPPIPSAWKAGAARTLIGVGIGASVGLGFWCIPWFSRLGDTGNVLFFSLLIPVRVFEWWLLLRWIYREFELSRRQRTALIAGGIVTSFALDALGIAAAFVLPGGMWVC
jgi:hypothetical protein